MPDVTVILWRDTVTRDGEAEEAVAAEAARIEQDYTDDVLARLIRARGLEGDD